MSIIQISKIQQRSGNLVDLPQLDEAEFGWASDEKKLFIGKTDPNENVEILTSYSNVNFGAIVGSYGNLDINPETIQNGQVLTFNGTDWTNRGGNSGGTINLGDIGNVKILGGAIGYVLETDGTGNLSWSPKGTLISNIANVQPALLPTYATTATDTFANDYILIGNANGYASNTTITFTGNAFGNIVSGNLYYVGNVDAGNNLITIKNTASGANVTLSAASGNLNVNVVGTILTTAGNNFFTEGAEVTITDAVGMTELNGNTFYVDVISANTFALFTDSTLTQPLYSNNFNAYSFTTLVESFYANLVIEVANTAQFTVNTPVQFTGDLGNSNLSTNTTYYINAITSGTTLKVSTTIVDGVAGPALQVDNQLFSTAGIYTEGGRVIGSISGSSATDAAGANTTVQYNSQNQLAGSADFRFDFNSTPKILRLNGTANISNISFQGVTQGPQFISNVAQGTAPLVVLSNTKVGNLNADLLDDYDTSMSAVASTVAIRDANGSLTANVFIGNNANITGQYISTLGIGNAPLVVTSTTKVTNLNADLLDGYDTAVANTANTIVVRDANGNVSANYFIGNGSALTGIDTSLISNGNTNVRTLANANVAVNVAGTSNVVVISSNSFVVNAQTITSNLTIASNITAPSWTTNGVGFRINSATYTDNSTPASSTFGNQHIHVISQPTLAAANTNVVVTNSATLYIANRPVAGNNQTITNPYSLYINDGPAYFNSGTFTLAGNVSASNWTTSGIGLKILGATYTANGIAANGNTATSHIHTIAQPTIAAANANVTITDASTLYIANAPANGTNVTTITNSYALFVAAGNSYFGGRIVGSVFANGTSNIAIPAANGNVNISAAGNANIVAVTGTGVNIAGTLNATGNANTGNLGTATAIITTGNITTINSGLMQNGNSNVTLTANANLQMFITGNANARFTAGSLGVNATPTFTLSGDTTAANWGVAGIGLKTLAANYTANGTAANGIIPINHVHAIAQPTLAASNANTFITEAATFYIANRPAVGTNVNTITNSYALYVGSGNSLFSSGSVIVANAITANNWGSSGIGFKSIAATYTDANSNAAAVIANTHIHAIARPTLASNNAITVTNAATFYIDNAPNTGTNMTISNAYALFVGSGNSYFNGNVTANYYFGNGSQLTGITVSKISNGNSNVDIAAAAGNVTFAVNGNTNIMTVTGTGVNVANYLTIGGNTTSANFIGPLANGNSSIKISTNGNANIDIANSANSNSPVTVAVFATDGIYTAANIEQTGGTGRIRANGNIISNANISSNNASISNNMSAGSVSTANITAPVGAITISANGTNQSIFLAPTGTGIVDVNNKRISSLGAVSQPNDAATKEYVDSIGGTGLTIHTPANVLAATNLNGTYVDGGTTQVTNSITGGKTITFSAAHGLSVNDGIVWTNSFNGIVGGEAYWVFSVASATAITIKDGYFGAEVTTLTNATGLTQPSRANPGVGATLTNAGANAALVIDSITLATNDRVLVIGQTTTAQNGTYIVSNTGNASAKWILTRSTDMNKYNPGVATGLGKGAYFFVTQGSNAGAAYVMTSPNDEVIIGTDGITFTQFATSSVYTAGSGINLTGTSFSVNTDGVTTAIVSGNVVVKSSANLTTPNIGVATGISLTVTGNLSANNLSISNLANITGNVTTDANVLANINVVANGNITAGNVLSANTLNISNNGTITGNLTVGNIIGVLANVNSNVAIPAANGNVNITANSRTNFIVAFDGAYANRSLTVQGNVPNITSWTTNGIAFRTLANTYTTDLAANSTLATFAPVHAISTPTIAGSNVGITFTDAATLYVANSPTAGTNITITNAYSLYVAAGPVYFNSGTFTLAGNITATNWTTNGIGLKILAATYTLRGVAANDTTASSHIHAIAQPTIASANANIFITNASTFYIANAPVAGTNVNTITNSYSIFVAAGNSYFGAGANIVGNANIGNVGTNRILASGNITTTQFISNIATGTAPLVVTSTTKVANLNADTLDGYDTATAATANTVAVRDANGSLTANVFIGNSANITGQFISTLATGNAPLVVTSTTKVANLNADTLDGYDTATAATANTVAVRDANGNVSANFFIGNGSQLTGLSTSSISNGNSNVSIPAANGNVTISAVGNANIVTVTGTGVNVAGTLNVSGTIIGNNPIVSNTFIESPYKIVAPTGLVYNSDGGLTSEIAGSGLNLYESVVGATLGSTARYTLYVVSNSSNYIYVYTIDRNSGLLTFLNIYSTGTGPRGITIHPTGKYLYVVNNVANTISQFGIDQSTGQLTSLAVAIAAGTNPLKLVVDPTGKFLFAINAGSNNISSYTISQTTGVLTFIANTSVGTNPGGITIDPTGRFLYVTNSDSNTVSQFSINLSTGVLTSIATAIATGVSPRAITVEPSGRFVYVGNYTAGTISLYTINSTTGALSLLDTITLGGTNYSTIVIDPTGRYLYVGENTAILICNINQSTGNISLSSSMGGFTTRDLSIDPTSRFLYQTNSTTSIYLHVINNLASGSMSVAGNISVQKQIISSIATGTAPLVVTSTTKVANLNADTLDGYDTATAATANTVAVRDANGSLTANFFLRSVTTSISAAGTVQSNATALSTEFNVVSTVATGAGVRLPTNTAGMAIIITNTSANNLLVYPPTSGIINSLAANASYTQPSGSTLQYIATSSTQWYTVGATYA